MSLSQITIRQAGFPDIENLVSLLKVLFSIEEDFVFNEELQLRGLELMLRSENACVLIAESDSKIVGMCSGQLTISTAEGGPALLIEDVVVREESRCQGTGKELLDTIALWGEKKGVSRIQLLADKNNEQALKFYKKLGWKTTQLICLRKHHTASHRAADPNQYP